MYFVLLLCQIIVLHSEYLEYFHIGLHYIQSYTEYILTYYYHFTVNGYMTCKNKVYAVASTGAKEII